MGHKRRGKLFGLRRKGILWDHNWDGGKVDRFDKFWKRYWSRWLRRQGNKELG
jgi:hypothetical protein